MNPKINRTLLTTIAAFTLLFAVAAFALTSPKMSPTAAIVHTGDHLQFFAAKSNDQVWEKWQLIENATGSSIDQKGYFTAGPNPGTAYVYVTTGDFGSSHPSIAQVTIMP
jgi:hypothetical protein